MDSIIFSANSPAISTVHHCFSPCTLAHYSHSPLLNRGSLFCHRLHQSFRPLAVPFFATASSTNSLPERDGIYTVGDFMTGQEDLIVVKPYTSVDEALDTLVEKRITGFPVIDDDWNLVGVVSDYDLLALDSMSGLNNCQQDTNLFPDVDSSWKTFNEIQKLLSKNHGKVVGDLMTPAPLVVRDNTNLEDAVRLLLETKYRRLPVVNADGKLVGIITRGNVVSAALQIKRAGEKM